MPQPLDLHRVRNEYTNHALDINHVTADPVKQLQIWLEQALQCQAHEPTAMMLSTCASDGSPDCRVVLLKQLDHGLVFFSHYQSKKGCDLQSNTAVALTFFWPQLSRQVRIQGRTEKLTRQESIDYFDSRPLGSRISAIISPQSQTIDSLNEFSALRTHLEKHTEQVQCPEVWGGYRTLPHHFEFWQGRPNRFHDRIDYVWVNADDRWLITRKAP